MALTKNTVRARRAPRGKMPEKDTINLMQFNREQERRDTRLLLWILAFTVLLAAVFYGGLRPWWAMRAAESRADAAEAETLRLQELNADYDQVARRYNLYYGPYLNEEEARLLERADILDLLERVVMPAARITSLEIPASNSFALRLSGISVKGMHDLLLELGEEPLVAMAGAPSLSTAEELGTSASIEFELYITVVDAAQAAQ